MDDEHKIDFDKDLNIMSEIMNKIAEIYRENNGYPDPKPPLKCFSCGKDTTSYGCILDPDNPEFHFLCDHCGVGFITPQ